jgi:hypothetical protein
VVGGQTWMDDRINLSDSVNPQPSIRTVTCIAKLIEAFAEVCRQLQTCSGVSGGSVLAGGERSLKVGLSQSDRV